MEKIKHGVYALDHFSIDRDGDPKQKIVFIGDDTSAQTEELLRVVLDREKFRNNLNKHKKLQSSINKDIIYHLRKALLMMEVRNLSKLLCHDKEYEVENIPTGEDGHFDHSISKEAKERKETENILNKLFEENGIERHYVEKNRLKMARAAEELTDDLMLNKKEEKEISKERYGDIPLGEVSSQDVASLPKRNLFKTDFEDVSKTSTVHDHNMNFINFKDLHSFNFKKINEFVDCSIFFNVAGITPGKLLIEFEFDVKLNEKDLLSSVDHFKGDKKLTEQERLSLPLIGCYNDIRDLFNNNPIVVGIVKKIGDLETIFSPALSFNSLGLNNFSGISYGISLEHHFRYPFAPTENISNSLFKDYLAHLQREQGINYKLSIVLENCKDFIQSLDENNLLDKRLKVDTIRIYDSNTTSNTKQKHRIDNSDTSDAEETINTARAATIYPEPPLKSEEPEIKTTAFPKDDEEPIDEASEDSI